MKTVYLTLSIIFTVAILIVAFENIVASTRYFLLLFTSVDGIGPFFIIMIIALLGAITGFFYAMSVSSILSNRNSDDDF